MLPARIEFEKNILKLNIEFYFIYLLNKKKLLKAEDINIISFIIFHIYIYIYIYILKKIRKPLPQIYLLQNTKRLKKSKNPITEQIILGTRVCFFNLSVKFIIIIIIMSHYQHGYFWPSLATPPYRPLLLAGPQYRHRAAVCKFEQDVLPLLVHVKGSTGVHHLRARPYLSSSVPHVWFV